MKSTPRTDALMHRLQRYLEGKRGRQTLLARHLYPNAPRQGIIRISEWVARARNPNGETSLAILEWLDGRG